MLDIDVRIKIAWKDVDPKAVIAIGPLGSRPDYLLFNRLNNEVTTGNIGTDRPCWISTLDEFEKRVEESYATKIAGSYTEDGKAVYRRWQGEYEAAIAFLRTLPAYAAVDDAPVAYA